MAGEPRRFEMKRDDPGSAPWPTEILEGGTRLSMEDPVVVEDPLHIRARSEGGPWVSVGITMRTPGADRDLVLGFLFGERVIDEIDDVVDASPSADPRPLHQGFDVTLRQGRLDGLEERSLLVVGSACGVCGKAAIDASLEGGTPVLSPGPEVPFELLVELPGRMRREQRTFEKTGGIHAAALFDAGGRLEVLREDVGRHNAVDKVVGDRLARGGLPLTDRVLVVSGRLGFEIVQKAVRAGVPVVASVGAPTTLSVRLASRAGMTVVGFLREGRANVYCGGSRVRS